MLHFISQFEYVLVAVKVVRILAWECSWDMFLKDSEESMPQRNQRWSSIFLTHARLVYYSFNYLIGKSASAQAITKLGQPGKVGDKRNVLGVHAATHPHNLPWEGNLQVLGERTVG